MVDIKKLEKKLMKKAFPKTKKLIVHEYKYRCNKCGSIYWANELEDNICFNCGEDENLTLLGSRVKKDIK